MPDITLIIDKDGVSIARGSLDLNTWMYLDFDGGLVTTPLVFMNNTRDVTGAVVSTSPVEKRWYGYYKEEGDWSVLLIPPWSDEELLFTIRLRYISSVVSDERIFTLICRFGTAPRPIFRVLSDPAVEWKTICNSLPLPGDDVSFSYILKKMKIHGSVYQICSFPEFFFRIGVGKWPIWWSYLSIRVIPDLAQISPALSVLRSQSKEHRSHACKSLFISPPIITMKRGFLNTSKAMEKSRKEHQNDEKTESLNSVLKEIKGGKLSYGVVKDAGRPKGYESVPIVYKELDANINSCDDDVMLYTTQPSQHLNATLADVPDGWSECYISALAKRRILSTPGFPQPIARPRIVRHRITQSPSKGLGMFATRDLDMGDLIFAERPIIVTPTTPRGQAGNLRGFSAEQVRQAMLYDWEKQVEIVLARADPENQAAFRALHNSHLHDGSGPIMGVNRTNGYGIGTFRDGDEGGSGKHSYSGIFKDASRINHSCSPNVTRHWDTRSFSMQFRAVRAIKKNEELTTLYCSLMWPSAKRQEALAPYEIRCDCPACTNFSVSDPRRAELARWPDAEYTEKFKSWLANPALKDDMMINILKEKLRVLEEEGLEEAYQYREVLYQMMSSYVVLADEENAIVWGKRLGKWDLAHTGNQWELTRLSRGATHRADAQWGLRKVGGKGELPMKPEMMLEMFSKLGV